METNNVLKLQGYRALLKELGPVEAEKFITLIQQEPFDYTEWQKSLWIDKDIKELSAEAVERRKYNKTSTAT
jgi:hypothetical protein